MTAGTKTDDAYGFYNWSIQKATENWVKRCKLVSPARQADHESPCQPELHGEPCFSSNKQSKIDNRNEKTAKACADDRGISPSVVIKFCCQTTTDSHAGQQEGSETRRVLVPVSATAYLPFGSQGNGFARPSFPPPWRTGAPLFSEQWPMLSSYLREQTEQLHGTRYGGFIFFLELTR